jgi:hypothetical protein
MVFYYFCHIILLSTEHRNMSIFQDHEVCHSYAVILLLSFIIKRNLNLVDNSVFQILEFHHTKEINNKWKPQYYCLLYMNTSVSDGNRFFFQVYPTSAFLNTSILRIL